MSLVLFYVLGGLLLLAALMVVTLKNVFHSALFLVAAFFLVAGIYLMLNAEFLAGVQVLIYVGAITILILFAIMLTHKIQVKAIRQVNEQVVPAIIISGLLLAIAVLTITRSFGDRPPQHNTGSWTGTFETGRVGENIGLYDWSAILKDNSGNDYSAFGSFRIYKNKANGPHRPVGISRPEQGYVISSNSAYTTVDTVFSLGQNVYLKMWSNGVDYGQIATAEWHIFKIPEERNEEEPWKLINPISEKDIITIELTNSNPESMGRLLLSKFVLPFEVVSVLLLAALIGAIVIARKDD